jgi:hypothetical protein
MKVAHNLPSCLIAVATITMMAACYKSHYIAHDFRKQYSTLKDAFHDTTGAVLKAHLKNGSLAVFTSELKVDPSQSVLSGNGIFYDYNRVVFKQGLIELQVKNVALFETNKRIESLDGGRIAGMTVLSVIDGIGAVLCLTNPKACFGSCPTFYVEGNNNLMAVNAEGFSSSITPAFEAHDIDALNNPPVTKHDYLVTMKNEAWETHSVNTVKLLAVPRNKGESVFHSVSDEFYTCNKIVPVNEAISPEGNCTDVLKNIDSNERFSTADSNWLNTKENIDLLFKNVDFEKAGLILNFRQTLLTTFLLYTAYGYMGDEAASFLAEIETNNMVRNKMRNRLDLLGGIEVYLWNENNNSWKYQGMFHEVGPIAKNLQLLVFDNELKNQSEIKVRLRLAKGLWRLDYAALSSVSRKVQPLELLPEKIISKGKEDKHALEMLKADDNDYLTSMPGNEYELHYSLPDVAGDYALFLYSKGYYLEWIRGEWLRHKNTAALYKMMQNDKQTWSNLAHEFKSVESSMEATFWSSNVVQ